MAASKHKAVADIAAIMSSDDRVQADAELARLRSEVATLRGRYKAALSQIDRERERSDALVSLKGIRSVGNTGGRQNGSRRRHAATAVLMLSDVHAEERVDPATVNDENEYTLDICQRRLDELQARFFDMLDHERRLADITRVVVWVGGDTITGHIHPDCMEVAQLSPQNATRWIAERLRGLIDAVAKRAKSVVVCTNAGNHGRSTEKNRVATELDHSWEQLMYYTLAREERNKNVDWRIATGHLGYLDLDGFVLRHTHGHSIRYSGGVYGLALPAGKAIAAWDVHRRADLTIFGHYHSWNWVDGSRYISNGSVIGKTAYSVHIKASTRERPRQGFFVIDHGRNEVTRAYPLYCDGDLKTRKGAHDDSDG